LELLLCHHPNWPDLKRLLETGSNWPLRPIQHQDWLAKNRELIERGNDKSAVKYTAELQKTLEKEVSQGWMIPLPITYISTLQNGELAPAGMDNKQWSELPSGEKQTKISLNPRSVIQCVSR
jgi:hypothetical protein